MANNTSVQDVMTVYGNVQSFNKLISNHGQLCKIKQSIPCPCVAKNNGSPESLCEICNGDGYVFSYQRHFTVNDEDSAVCGNTIQPFMTPIISVKEVQSTNHPTQGGIENLQWSSFTDTEIIFDEDICPYTRKRVTYAFDGWTHVESEKLRVDVVNKIMYADGTVFNAEYQSSNPLKAYSDIAQVVKIWNNSTGKELKNYTFYGNSITTTETISANDMYIEYYYADLQKVITADIALKNNSEVFTHDLTSGECRMSFYPYIELTRGDIITLPACVLYTTQQIKHKNNLDKLWEIEVYNLNNFLMDEDGVKYYIDTDYILQGRHIKWIGNQPSAGKYLSVRYGYKPSYIVFEDNPQPNTLENKQYPITVFAKSWTKTSPKDLVNIMGNN